MIVPRIRKIALRRQVPTDVKMTLEKNGWFLYLTVNDTIMYKKVETEFTPDKPKLILLPPPVDPPTNLTDKYGIKVHNAVQGLMRSAGIEPTKIPPSTIPTVIRQAQRLVPIETRVQNVLSFYPNPADFPGPARQRLHNIIQGLEVNDPDRLYVEQYMEEHLSITGKKMKS